MKIIKRENVVYVQLRDRLTKESRSFSIYGASLQEVYVRLRFYTDIAASTDKPLVILTEKGEKDEKGIE